MTKHTAGAMKIAELLRYAYRAGHVEMSGAWTLYDFADYLDRETALSDLLAACKRKGGRHDEAEHE